MPHPGLNPRQEAFVGSNREAYQKVYSVGDRVADANAARMLADAKVKARLREMQAKAADKAAVTVETIAAELDQAWKLAFVNRQAGACVAASLVKARLYGLITDKQQLEVIHKPSPLPTSVLELDEDEWVRQFSSGHREAIEAPGKKNGNGRSRSEVRKGEITAESVIAQVRETLTARRGTGHMQNKPVILRRVEVLSVACGVRRRRGRSGLIRWLEHRQAAASQRT